MVIKTRGICLHTTKYAESSVIAQVYTEQKGLQSYIISGVRTTKPKVHASLLQPMTLLDLVAYFRPDQSLFRTKEIRPARTFMRIPFELPRSSVCLFAAEVLLKALRESEAQAELFDFVVEFVEYVDTTNRPLANLPSYFLMHIIDFLGFRPEHPNFGAPYFFDQSQGYFLPDHPDHERYADEDVSLFLVKLIEADLSDASDIPSSRQIRQQALVVMLDYLRSRIDRFQGITSHRVLAEVLRA